MENKRKYPTFKDFLKSNWWFLLLVFAKAFNNSEKNKLGFGGVIIMIGILLVIMFIYWFIRYGRKK